MCGTRVSKAADTDGKKEIATRFLKNIIAAQAQWDRVRLELPERKDAGTLHKVSIES